MPKKQEPKDAPRTAVSDVPAPEVATETIGPIDAPLEEVLVPFNIILDGQDRTIFAKDFEDLQSRIDKMLEIAKP